MKIQIDLNMHHTEQLRAFSKLMSDYADEVDALDKKDRERRAKSMAVGPETCEAPMGAYLG